MTPANETEKQLFDLMTQYEFVLGPSTFTVRDLQNGFSLCFSLMFLWSGVMSLVLSYKLSKQRNILFSIGLINTLALLMGSGISLRYFFLPPTACFVLAMVFFGSSLFVIQSGKNLPKV